jgi:hypothetical protein
LPSKDVAALLRPAAVLAAWVGVRSIAENKGGVMFLGIQDIWVWLAYILCILSTLLCVVYGFVNWNKGEEPVKPEDVDWAKEEKTEVEDAV